MSPNTKPQGTLRWTVIGSVAILMWSTLALLTTWAEGIPPLQLTAMAFTIASLFGLAYGARQGKLGDLLRLPWQVWLFGVCGLFGFHFFYFVALSHAPAVEASLIAYLWPLLLVLFSSLLPGESLRWYQMVGALLGFSGVTFLLGGGGELNFDWTYALGYLAALGSALTWSTYSVLSKRWGEVPTTSVAGLCLATTALAWGSHALLETTVRPVGGQWVAIALLGTGPVGLAFYFWDAGVKRGQIKVLGTLSYFAPLLSTFLLIAAGRALFSWTLLSACGLIVGGALLASVGEFLGERGETSR